ncbi:MAG: Na/Pi symporter [Deltaproteobacteria bacterium]|nr:Na/Pi symporter [Deltaproteobacteria bacterium]
MPVPMIAALLGGIGLFLLGMRLMTEGLKLATGRALRGILIRSTGTRLRGVLSGALITSIVQSSSAVTVATIGFVNAGILSLAQAIAIIYGSNVGTTATAWIVALVGFHVNIKALALPAVGLGMLLSMMGREARWRAAGQAVAGLGVFFLGIDVLQNAFQGLGEGMRLDGVPADGMPGLLAFLAVGFLLTLLTQSSSAALAITLTAAAGQVIPIESAAAAVIGANVGTTSTAALSALGATPNAKRAAGAHLAFNVLTGAVALLLLPWLVPALVRLRIGLGFEAAPAAVLALFHTTFNVLGILLLWPFTDRLVRYLQTRFRSQEENESRPVYLDRNVLAAPSLAVQALTMELRRIGSIALRMAKGVQSIEGPAGSALASDRNVIDALVEAVGGFSNLIQRGQVPKDLEDALPNALRVSRYYSELAELATNVAVEQAVLEPIEHPELAAEQAGFRRLVVEMLERAEVGSKDFSLDDCAAALAEVEEAYQAMKNSFLRAGTRGELRVRAMVDVLDLYSDIRRMAQQAEKGALQLASLEAFSRDENAR